MRQKIQIQPNNELILWLKKNLDEERLLHSLGCAQCASELANKFKLNEQKAYLAGLLHDCAKCFSEEKTLELSQKLNLDEDESNNYKVIHAPLSAYIAENEFGIRDEEILSAIRWHTLGKINMSDFEKIIFLADKIEPNTRDSEFRNKILFLLDTPNGINKSLLICYKETIKSLVQRNLKICTKTIDIYNNLLLQ
jgi:predicted HD superfamily hydrolase involved in NAD metabolism